MTTVSSPPVTMHALSRVASSGQNLALTQCDAHGTGAVYMSVSVPALGADERNPDVAPAEEAGRGAMPSTRKTLARLSLQQARRRGSHAVLPARNHALYWSDHGMAPTSLRARRRSAPFAATRRT